VTTSVGTATICMKAFSKSGKAQEKDVRGSINTHESLL